MKLACLMPVRTEDWCLGLTARAALMWCDELIALAHACTDNSVAILQEIARETGKVRIMEQPDPLWTEMAHRQALLTIARQYGATHIATVDADEVLSGNLIASIRGIFQSAPPKLTLQVPWICLRSP